LIPVPDIRLFLFVIFGIILLLAVTIELLMMILMRYDRFKKCLVNAVLVNLCTLVIGYILISAFQKTGFDNRTIIAMYGAGAFIVESLILYSLNSEKPLVRTIRVSLAMNLVSSLVFIGISFLSEPG
jgi:hypothetical protein